MSDPRLERDGRNAEIRARRGRNIALALGLTLFVALVFVVTIVKLGANVVERPF